MARMDGARQNAVIDVPIRSGIAFEDTSDLEHTSRGQQAFLTAREQRRKSHTHLLPEARYVIRNGRLNSNDENGWSHYSSFFSFGLCRGSSVSNFCRVQSLRNAVHTSWGLSILDQPILGL